MEPAPRVTGQCDQTKPGWYLGDDGQLRTQVMEPDVGHVEAVNVDFTLSRLQDAEQAESHGRFASPSAAHDPHLERVGGCQAKAGELVGLSLGLLCEAKQTPRLGTCHPTDPHSPGTNPPHTHLLATMHSQTQVLQHQLQARPVAHGIISELHLTLQWPACWRTAALHHPGGLVTRGGQVLHQGDVSSPAQPSSIFSLPLFPGPCHPHLPGTLAGSPWRLCGPTLWFSDSIHLTLFPTELCPPLLPSCPRCLSSPFHMPPLPLSSFFIIEWLLHDR